MREPAATCEGAGPYRDLRIAICGWAWLAGAASGWEHLTRQFPMSGQDFCGQSGQGLAGLWQGISDFVAAAA